MKKPFKTYKGYIKCECGWTYRKKEGFIDMIKECTMEQFLKQIKCSSCKEFNKLSYIKCEKENNKKQERD